MMLTTINAAPGVFFSSRHHTASESLIMFGIMLGFLLLLGVVDSYRRWMRDIGTWFLKLWWASKFLWSQIIR
jgi:hypothetical protein